MKACTRCGVEKPEEGFAKNGAMGRHTSCKACQAAAHRLKRLMDPEAAREADRRRAEATKEKRRARCARYYERTREAKLAAEKARYAANAETLKEQARQYRAANPHKVQAWNGSRRAAAKQATPLWADTSQIAAFYAQAAKLTAETGVPHHVDHYYPLKGRTVSGLHVQDNLRVIEATANMRKGSRSPD